MDAVSNDCMFKKQRCLRIAQTASCDGGSMLCLCLLYAVSIDCFDFVLGPLTISLSDAYVTCSVGFLKFFGPLTISNVSCQVLKFFWSLWTISYVPCQIPEFVALVVCRSHMWCIRYLKTAQTASPKLQWWDEIKMMVLISTLNCNPNS